MKNIIAFALFASLLSCTQGSGDIVNQETWVRIENATTTDFNNTQIQTVGYSTVVSGTTTSYQLIPFRIYGAGCEFQVNGQPVTVGQWWCGTPPPPHLVGRYTFRIIPGTGNPPYRIEVTKD